MTIPLEYSLFNGESKQQWRQIGVLPRHGINLPLSALRSKNSCGIGEFFDLLPLIDWARRLGLSVIQMLPLNNSENDPSPYNVISSCALNPVYLSLHALPYLESLPEMKEKLRDFQALNLSERISYAEVFTHKMHWLRSYYGAVQQELLSSASFKSFIAENPWVETFSLFKALKTHLNGTSWHSWPEELRLPTPEQYKELLSLYQSEILFYEAIQFLCYSQLKNVKEHSHKAGLLLMGDIPILVSSESVDVWHHQNYFDTTLGAGAPPDFYNKEGQTWGMPPFRWDAMRMDGYSWWKQRLKYAENFYDIFRIDHIIGFFRLWAVPHGHVSKEGHFIPEKEEAWKAQGRELLKMILSSTQMLPIAEDLGLVPKCVPPQLQEFNICGTKVMRWEREWKKDKSPIPLSDYPLLSLTTLSTHDSETLAQWWMIYPEEAQAFAKAKKWNYTPTLTLSQRRAFLFDSHHTESLFHINLLSEYLALFPELVSDAIEKERINIPGKVLPSNWTYRFKPSVEELTTHDALFKAIQELVPV